MKNEKNYMGFHIPKIWQILKWFDIHFHWAQTLKLWGVTEYMIDWIRQLFQSFHSVCWRRNSPNFNLCYVNMYIGTTTPWSFFFFCLLKAFFILGSIYYYYTRTYLWSKWITAAPFKLHREGYIWSLKWAIQKFHYCTNLHYSKNCTNPLASIPIAFLYILGTTMTIISVPR